MRIVSEKAGSQVERDRVGERQAQACVESLAARGEPAQELLAAVYARFTEGQGTADLRAARALLDILA